MMIDSLNRATSVILEGGIILYPTDTIWGIGCDATNPSAVRRIYEIKQRSDRKSMLVLMENPSMLTHYLELVPENILEVLRNTIKPTTVIYPRSRNFADNLPAEDGSIGIRITSDPFCRELIRNTGTPIVSTSANISGQPAPQIFDEIERSLLPQVDYVVAWRQEEKVPAQPSTILRLGPDGNITVLRP
jgi:L-threonylcarbamoyladenylate synthase